ncbi:AMP-binding protein [Cumulibacter manganitolerans]|uniref:AMP-binding protein n=1 Tax=Cumulibacter manganitolerans TaxID=1884992 RepID=UPI001296AB47|nr:AMP-binding protein [Cumulibacter manganitolerans]
MDVDEYLAEAERRRESVRPDVPRQVVYPRGEVPIGEYVRGWARETPDAIALAFYGRELTWREIDDLSDRAAGWLETQGVQAGDRVGVLLPNSPQFVIAFIAIMKLGAVHVPINVMFREHELHHELTDADVKVLFCVDSMLDVLGNVIGETAVESVLVTSAMELAGDDPALPAPAAPPATTSPNVTPTATWRDLATASPAAPREVDLDALAALNYTGGTTGMPKGCEHSQRHMLYAVAAWMTASGVTGRPAFLCHVPVFWIAGEDMGILSPILTGGTCVLLARWDAEAVMRSIERYRVSIWIATVDNYVEIMEHPDAERTDFSSLTTPLAMSFVARVDPEVRQRWRETSRTDGVLREAAYGMTETHTMDTSTYGLQDDDWDILGEPGQCGLPVPGTDIMVVDPATAEILPLGERGEIVLRSPSILTAYWRRPDATDDAIRDGWLHTGDTGFIDEAGCLHYLVRNKDMIKVNGMSVFPAEVEAYLCRHDDVEVAAVVPRPDPDKGQVPVAFVKAVAGRDIDPDALRAWAKTQMATYKVPEMRVVDEFPMTTTGKIKKAELAAQTQDRT